MPKLSRQPLGINYYSKKGLAFAGCAAWMATGANASDTAGASKNADGDGASIIVTGERNRIESLNSRIGDVRDAPQSVSIISRQIIEQQAAANLRDVIRNISGLSFTAGEGGGGPGSDNLTLRGFGARNDIFVDGIRDSASYTRDTFNIEQVEVVKGPASAQTGRGSTGGTINIFTKRPQARTFDSGTIGIGAPQYLRATADINIGGKDIGLGSSVAGRVNLLYHDARSPGRDFIETRRAGVAPSLAFGLGSATRAIATYMLLDQYNVPDNGIPFVPATQNGVLLQFRDRPAPVDYDNFYGVLERDYEDLRANILTLALEHDLSPSVRLANAARFGHSARDSIVSSPRFLATPDNDSALIRPQPQSRDTIDTILVNQSQLFASLGTGPFQHEINIGLEISEERSSNQLRLVTEGTPTGLFDPDPKRPWIGTISKVPGGKVKAEANSVAAYIFDTIQFSDQWLFSGGLRLEKLESSFQPAAPAAKLERTDKTVTWRAGMTYRPTPTLSMYAGAGTSVNPSLENLTQTTPTLALAALSPERSRTFEIGGKWEALKDQLLITGALFRTEKKNARTPGLPGDPPTVLEGRQRVDGMEIGVTGWITSRWQILGAYSYQDSEVVESNSAAEIGNRLVNVPGQSGTFWSAYKLPAGLEIGGGLRYIGSRYTSLANNRRVEGYWTVDSTIAYELGPRLTIRGNLLNLFDKEYEDQISGGHFIPGPGRSAVLTLAIN